MSEVEYCDGCGGVVMPPPYGSAVNHAFCKAARAKGREEMREEAAVAAGRWLSPCKLRDDILGAIRAIPIETEDTNEPK